MKVKLGKPVYSTKGEPSFQLWFRWFSVYAPPGLNGYAPLVRGNDNRATRCGFTLRLPGGRQLRVYGPRMTMPSMGG